MTLRYVALAMTLLLASLAAATPGDPTEALLRRGHAAFAHADYAAAADFYDRASLRATDPSRATLCLATAKYRLAEASGGQGRELHEAEQLYRSCLGPADARRPEALYGLGNCLLMKASGRDATAVRTALRCYDECLRAAKDDALRADASYNRERAQLLLLQLAPPEGSSEDRPLDNDHQPPNTPQGPERTQPGARSPEGDPGAEGKPEGKAGQVGVKPEPGQQPKPGEGDPPPGAGDLPPVPDQADLPPLSGRDARAHLEQAQQKIAQERQAHRRQAIRRPAETVPAW